MKRPAFQFYPADWRNNAKLRRCTEAARGAWMDVLCILHDSDEYGVCRWPLDELARAAGVSLRLVKELVDKEVLKGAAAGKECGEYIYTPRTGRKEGDPVVLIQKQAGPIWYSSRFVRDEYVRKSRGASTRFAEKDSEKSSNDAMQQASSDSVDKTSQEFDFNKNTHSPTARLGDTKGDSQGDGSTSSSSSSYNNNINPLTPLTVDNFAPPDANLNHFQHAFEAICKLLGQRGLDTREQEILCNWCEQHDMRGFVFPLIIRALKNYQERHAGQNPAAAIAYFDKAIKNEASRPSMPVRGLLRKIGRGGAP
ncbi:MAG: hypothetical protein SFX19_10075 [Alphaproteobacteria bacterium]|nr:hypothetical protein [Alphaproteobacteria bacterium]